MKRFNYEYDASKELILKSLCGKSTIGPKDLQQLFTILIHQAYEKNKGKSIL
jgi:hypothetical protein